MGKFGRIFGWLFFFSAILLILLTIFDARPRVLRVGMLWFSDPSLLPHRSSSWQLLVRALSKRSGWHIPPDKEGAAGADHLKLSKTVTTEELGTEFDITFEPFDGVPSSRFSAVIVNLDAQPTPERLAILNLLLPADSFLSSVDDTVFVAVASLPPPLSPLLTAVQERQLGPRFHSTISFHPFSFLALHSHPSHPLPSPSPHHDHSNSSSLLLSKKVGLVGEAAELALPWVKSLGDTLQHHGFQTMPVNFDASSGKPSVSGCTFYVVLESALCEGHAGEALRRALASPHSSVAYLGTPHAHFHLGDPFNLVDIRNYPHAAQLGEYMASLYGRWQADASTFRLHHDISALELRLYGDWKAADGSVAEAIDQLADLLAWRRLLFPMPALGGWNAWMVAPCSTAREFFSALPPWDVHQSTFLRTAFSSHRSGEEQLADVTIYADHAKFYQETPAQVLKPAPWTGAERPACLLPWISACRIVTVREEPDFNKVHAIYNHLRSFPSLEAVPVKQWQAIIGDSTEAAVNDWHPTNEAVMRRHTHLFDVHPSSDYLLVPKGGMDDILKIERTPFAKRSSSVLWVASNCESRRTPVIKRLMSSVDIVPMGACLNPSDQRVAKDQWKAYKFYLSWENTVCHDYVTEKLWRPLADAVVPLYVGAPNVIQFAPTTHSVVPLSLFESAQRLSSWLDLVTNSEPLFNYLIAHRISPTTPVRRGFLFYIYLSGGTLCDEYRALCNLVTRELPNIELARNHGHELRHSPHHADESCKVDILHLFPPYLRPQY